MEIAFILPWLKTSILKIYEFIDGKLLLKEMIELSDPKQENQMIFSFLKIYKLTNLKKILICNWPWRFMSLRLFSSIVNTLSNELDIKVYAINTAEFLYNQIASKWQILLQLNQKEVLVYNNRSKEICEISKIKSDTPWYWYMRNELLLNSNMKKIDESNVLKDENLILNFLTDRFRVKQLTPIYR